MKRYLLAIAFGFALAALPSSADDWPRFRGPDGQGIAVGVTAPTAWGVDDYEWSIDLPGTGHSSPVVFGEQLFLTAGTDAGSRITLCLNADTGAELWRRELAMRPSHLHKKNSYGSCTPIVGEAGVFVVFADEVSHQVVGYRLDGPPLWQRDLGAFTSQHGQGSSAILHNGLVIVANDQMGESSLTALSAETGDVVWTAEKAAGKTAYATPVVGSFSGHDVLICLSEAEGVAGFDPATGDKLFASGAVPLRVVASPVFVDGAVLISCGSGGKGKHMEVVVPTLSPGSSQWTTEKRWLRKKMLPYVPTPIVSNDLLFLWNDDGTVACVDPTSGDDIWKNRIGGNFSSSPILIGDRIYAVSEDGKIAVIDASREFRKYPGGEIKDFSYATPAVARGRAYFRGFQSLAALPLSRD